MTRGQLTVRNPAEAIAMSKCWLSSWVRRIGYLEARSMGVPAEDSFHPAKCAYCEEPRDYLIKLLEEFRDWSSISSDEGDLRMEIESFQVLPSHEQIRLVKQAQAAMLEEPHDPRSPW